MTFLIPKECDKNCLSYWFPRIQAAGLPVPETRIIRAEIDLTPLMDGESVAGFEGFLEQLRTAAEAIGYPVFLRTGHGSGKHDWLRTCCVGAEADIGQHVFNLVEWSACAGIMGLPTEVWVVRQMLPTKPFFTAFHGMPICREFRLFVENSEVVCCHPYWPRGALVMGFPGNATGREGSRQLPDNFGQLYEALCALPAVERFVVAAIASRAGEAFGGAWSVDVLETERDWCLIDMAEAHCSFHWDGCPEARRFCRPPT